MIPPVSGPLAVFLLFLLPLGPGAGGGIILARHEGLPAAATFGLYLLSDVVTAAVLDPLIRVLRSRGERSPVGQRILASFARVGSVTQVSSGRLGLPLGLFTFCFATDFYTAAFVSSGLPLRRAIAWIAIIAGDLIWFVILFVAMLGFASFLSDDRVLFVITLILGFALPPVLRRWFGRSATVTSRAAPPPRGRSDQ